MSGGHSTRSSPPHVGSAAIDPNSHLRGSGRSVGSLSEPDLILPCRRLRLSPEVPVRPPRLSPRRPHRHRRERGSCVDKCDLRGRRTGGQGARPKSPTKGEKPTGRPHGNAGCPHVEPQATATATSIPRDDQNLPEFTHSSSGPIGSTLSQCSTIISFSSRKMSAWAYGAPSKDARDSVATKLP